MQYPAGVAEWLRKGGYIDEDGNPLKLFPRLRDMPTPERTPSPPPALDAGGSGEDGHAEDGHAEDGHAEDGQAEDGHAEDAAPEPAPEQRKRKEFPRSPGLEKMHWPGGELVDMVL